MLKLRAVTVDTEGQWFDFTVQGETVRLKIRPLNTEMVNAIRDRYKKIKKVNGFTMPEYDEKKIVDDMADHVLEDVEGIGDEAGKPLAVNLQNKKRVMNIPPAEGEQPISEFIYEKARELCIIREEEQEKNS